MHRPGLQIIRDLNDEKVQSNSAGYFMGEKEKIHLGDGSVAVVYGHWGAKNTWRGQFDAFKSCAEKQGYKIYRVDREQKTSPYWYVNTGEREARPHRVWGNCQRYKFVAGGQDNNPDLPHSTASQLKKIPLGAIVFAYRSGFGYLGCGVVTQEATPIMGFSADNLTKTLGETLDVTRVRDGFIPEKEFAIGVDWLSDKLAQPGILKQYAYPKTASPIHDSERLRELKHAFGVVDENHDAD